MGGPDIGATESVEALAQTIVKLRSERDGLREAMRNRSVIEQAKGMLAERLSVDPESAFGHLVELSTHNNIKVAELAAAIVAREQEDPPELVEADIDAAPVIPAEMDPPEAEALAIDSQKLAAETRLIGGRIASATTFDELTDSIAVPTVAWSAPANVIVLLVEGDGALRLVGSAGLSATSRSQWDRVPPIENVPVVAAVQNRAPVYLADLEAVSRQFPVVADHPHEALVAMPLLDGDNVIGALEITWAKTPTLDEHARSHLLWLAEPAARHCVELSRRPEAFTTTSINEESMDTGLVALFLEALTFPAVLLHPRYGDNNQLVDFDPEYSNTAAASLVTKPNGRPMSLLTALPDSGARKLLPAFAATLRGGKPCLLRNVTIAITRDGQRRVYHADVRVTRLWEKLLVTWRLESEPARQFESLLGAERAFATGAFYWEFESEEIRWSPGMHHITGGDPGEPVPSIEDIIALIHPGDQAELVKDAMETLRAGHELRRELRGHGALKDRVFELVANPDVSAAGELRAVRGACRDITAERRQRDQVRRDRVSIAGVRAERDALRDVLAELRRFDRPDGGDGFDITGHTVTATTSSPCSWYDTVELPAGGLALIVGAVEGEDATASMLRLRLSTVAFAATGMNPAEAMSAANSAFVATVPGRTATMTLAFLDRDSGQIAWATSGQASPLVSRSGASAKPTSGSLGMPIGAASPMEFPLNQTVLQGGDQLLMYTDGLHQARGPGDGQLLDMLRQAAATASAEQAFEKVAGGDPTSAGIDASLLLIRRMP